jgi:ppGpp synthetase/RelA/SpoT-type nucleotidyltranferase
MMQRKVEDFLREEYFRLSPEISRVLDQLQTEITYLLLPARLELKHHERIIVEARVKQCDSAIEALRRREEARQFDEDSPENYTLASLPDLAALRVLVFPKRRLEEVHASVRSKYADWTSDPVKTGSPPKFRAYKYHGYCPTSSQIRAEIQVVSMLTGLFWQIDHDAFYKPRDPVLLGARKKASIQERIDQVYDAFEALEGTLEQELMRNLDQESSAK